ncbi:MAG: L-threonylcarbamoyladenylate synthase [Spirochaetaceae bacterium]
MRQAAEIGRAAEAIRAGRLVVFPTETVYGLGANALDAEAVARIFDAKGRPGDNPLIVHIADIAELSTVVKDPPEVAYRLLKHFSPGPLTVVLPRNPRIPSAVSAGLPTVAVRIPSHPVARELIRLAGVPIAAPSANRSGRPSPTDVETARRDLGDRVDIYLDGGPCEIGLESTVVRVQGASVEVLREGAVTREMLFEALGRSVGGGRAGRGAPSFAAESPGTRHAHYMPKARVVPFEETGSSDDKGTPDASEPVALLFLGEMPDLPELRHLRDPITLLAYPFGSLEEYARSLYRVFREADEKGCARIYAELPPARGIGRALRDRILRASGFANS